MGSAWHFWEQSPIFQRYIHMEFTKPEQRIQQESFSAVLHALVYFFMFAYSVLSADKQMYLLIHTWLGPCSVLPRGSAAGIRFLYYCPQSCASSTGYRGCSLTLPVNCETNLKKTFQELMQCPLQSHVGLLRRHIPAWNLLPGQAIRHCTRRENFPTL